MPKLSLYRPNKTSDYKFLDNTIREMYTAGGLDLHIHKYLGPKTVGDSATREGSEGTDAAIARTGSRIPHRVGQYHIDHPDPGSSGKSPT